MEVKDYPNYLIYDDGRVYSKYSNRFLKPNLNGYGYLKIVLCKDKKPKTFNIHKLVATHYIPLIEGKDQVDHIDRNKLNNNVSNLRWCSRSENQHNRGVHCNNKLGIQYINKRHNRYRFAISRNGKQYEKTFKTLEEAIKYRDMYLEENNLNI